MIKVAALQMISTPVVQDNLDLAAQLLSEAHAKGAELAVLPEYFCLMGHRDKDKLSIQEPLGQGPIQDFLSQQARSLGLWIVAGTIPLSTQGSASTRFQCHFGLQPQGRMRVSLRQDPPLSIPNRERAL